MVKGCEDAPQPQLKLDDISSLAVALLLIPLQPATLSSLISYHTRDDEAADESFTVWVSSPKLPNETAVLQTAQEADSLQLCSGTHCSKADDEQVEIEQSDAVGSDLLGATLGSIPRRRCSGLYEAKSDFSAGVEHTTVWSKPVASVVRTKSDDLALNTMSRWPMRTVQNLDGSWDFAF
jgi:hypothetical protein